jgi:hypothetical protein
MRRFVIWSLCPWLSLPLMAQDCRITGHIADANRAGVATAIVTVTQVDSELTRQVLSNADGNFQLARLPQGKYRIDVVKPGFKPLSRIGVELGKNAATTVDLQMEDARKAGAEFLLTYICGISLGSGCEMLEPMVIAAQTESPLLP